MRLYVVAREEGDDVLVVGMDGGVLAFETEHDAEDFSDRLDEEGEYIVLNYEEAMGPAVIVS